jgi:hypothetical protein
VKTRGQQQSVFTCGNLGNLWFLRGHQSIMQNKPNVKMGNINISTVRTKAYPKEQRTMNTELDSKQTQTNPISHPQIINCQSSIINLNPPAPLLRRERIQNLGAKRISRFIGPASKIENPVSRIKHLPHFAVHSWPHCAKQSQSQNG